MRIVLMPVETSMRVPIDINERVRVRVRVRVRELERRREVVSVRVRVVARMPIVMIFVVRDESGTWSAGPDVPLWCGRASGRCSAGSRLKGRLVGTGTGTVTGGGGASREW
jgi:hypothetical protein